MSSERGRGPTPPLEGPALEDDSFDGVLRDMAHVSSPVGKPVEGFAPGRLIAGKFRVVRRLGQGGMGAVYAVRHELTKHTRALKLLHSPDNPEIVQRFLAEASAAGRTGSPHLVESFDAGILSTGEPYLVMELLEGQTFGALLAREGKLAPELACELVAQAAEGMTAAHRAGIVHRDLKPDNLFIVQRADGPFVKILDFGISKFESASIAAKHSTLDHGIFGTPAYMAPEQMQNAKHVDARADVFALGAVLFACLGGEAPYEAGSLVAIVARIMSKQSTALESLRADLDPALVSVVRRAITWEPADRIPSAAALVAELAPFRIVKRASDVELEAQVPRRKTRSWLRVLALGFALVAVGSAYSWLSPAPMRQARGPVASASEQTVEHGFRTPTPPPAEPTPIAVPRLESAPASAGTDAGTGPTETAPGRKTARVQPRRAAATRASQTPRAEAGSPAPHVRSRVEELGLAPENPVQ